MGHISAKYLQTSLFYINRNHQWQHAVKVRSDSQDNISSSIVSCFLQFWRKLTYEPRFRVILHLRDLGVYIYSFKPAEAGNSSDWMWKWMCKTALQSSFQSNSHLFWASWYMKIKYIWNVLCIIFNVDKLCCFNFTLYRSLESLFCMDAHTFQHKSIAKFSFEVLLLLLIPSSNALFCAGEKYKFSIQYFFWLLFLC